MTIRKVFFILLVFFFWVGPGLVWAANPAVELTQSFTLADKQAVDGDILISTKDGLSRASQAFDNRLFGVLATTALLSYKSADQTQVPVGRNGIAQVNVTDLNGVVAKGDYITSSPIAGKGQKATGAGYVIGTALAGFDPNGATQVSFGGKNYRLNKVSVALRIEYAEISGPQSFKRLFDFLGSAFFSSVQDPNQFGRLVRYIAAALVVLIALAFALYTFSRTMPKAMEALGRNPLARRSIYLSMVATAVFVVFIILLGIGAAIIVLRV